MCSSPFKVDFLAYRGVNHNPIRLQMSVSVPAPVALERMVLVLRGQRHFREQQFDQALQLLKIFSSLLKPLDIALELGRITCRAHQIPSFLNMSSAFLASRTSIPRALLRMLSRVVLFGVKSKGKASSLATRVNTMRTTSETVRPISSRTAVAFSLTSARILERTTEFVASVKL